MTGDAIVDSLLEFGFDFSSDLFDSDESTPTSVSDAGNPVYIARLQFMSICL